MFERALTDNTRVKWRGIEAEVGVYMCVYRCGRAEMPRTDAFLG